LQQEERMKTLSTVVRLVNPGSQPEEEPLQYPNVARDGEVFRTPSVPKRADAEALSEARAVLAEFADALGPWDPALSRIGPRLDVRGVSPAALAIVNQMLGQGEVSIQISGSRPLHIQESIFTGVWRLCEIDASGLQMSDWIEAARLPEVVLQAAQASVSPEPVAVPLPEGAMRSAPILEEIRGAMRVCTSATKAHVINLTLLPLTPEDHRVLELALPAGPVAIISRGFGNCRITSTLVRNVWRVQYFNGMNTLILDTLEIVSVPEVALAAAEDLQDSRERLEDLVAWMGEDATA
jgi:hydrogenase-1 operon protein HyaF